MDSWGKSRKASSYPYSQTEKYICICNQSQEAGPSIKDDFSRSQPFLPLPRPWDREGIYGSYLYLLLTWLVSFLQVEACQGFSYIGKMIDRDTLKVIKCSLGLWWVKAGDLDVRGEKGMCDRSGCQGLHHVGPSGLH